MKDKRTYTQLKEHGVDMTYENESKVDPKEDRGSGDLSLLNELHRKEIWEWKQRESEYIQTKNLLDGAKQIINEMGQKVIKQESYIKNLQQEIERLLAEKNK